MTIISTMQTKFCLKEVWLTIATALKLRDYCCKSESPIIIHALTGYMMHIGAPLMATQMYFVPQNALLCRMRNLGHWLCNTSFFLYFSCNSDLNYRHHKLFTQRSSWNKRTWEKNSLFLELDSRDLYSRRDSTITYIEFFFE